MRTLSIISIAEIAEISELLREEMITENTKEKRMVMLTIKEAATLVDGLTEYRVRQLCRSGELPSFKAGKKYLINKEVLIRFLGGDTD